MQQFSDVSVREETLNQVLIFSIDCNIWSARKKLNPEDLPGISNLPPTQVMSLGSKRICDPEKIAAFEKLKRRAVRAAELVGSRFLGGYAVPKAKARDLAIELKALEAEFQQVRKDFLDGYTGAVDDWIGANPNWAEALRKAITPKHVVERRLGFAFSVTKVAAADDEDGLLSSGLLNELGSLSGQLFHEVARDARDLLEKSIVPRQGSITQRAISSLRKLQQKLEGFVFLDGQIGRVAKHFNEVLNRMPKAGHVEGRDFTELFGLVVILSDESKIRQFAAGYAAANEGVSIVVDAQAPMAAEVPKVEAAPVQMEIVSQSGAVLEEPITPAEVVQEHADFSDFDDLISGDFEEVEAESNLDEVQVIESEDVETIDADDEDEVISEENILPLVAQSEGMAPSLGGELVFF